VLDIAEDPAATLEALQVELSAYDEALLSLPALIVLNKIDLAAPQEVAAYEQELAKSGLPVVAISASEGVGLDALKAALFALIPERPALAPVARDTKRDQPRGSSLPAALLCVVWRA
jgi:GTPase